MDEKTRHQAGDDVWGNAEEVRVAAERAERELREIGRYENEVRSRERVKDRIRELREEAA